MAINSELLSIIKDRGLLLEKDVFELMSSLAEFGVARTFLESIEQKSGQKIITKSLLGQHFSSVQEIVRELPGDRKQEVEHVLVKLGLTVEILREKREVGGEIIDKVGQTGEGNVNIVKCQENTSLDHTQSTSIAKGTLMKDQLGVTAGNGDDINGYDVRVEVIGKGEGEDKKEELGYKLFYADTRPDKKLEVKDFIGYFRSRYSQMQGILMGRPELHQNLVSIGKLSGDRQSVSIIGMVKEKRTTKNGNLIIAFEDLTGEVNGLVKKDNEDLFTTADELQLDDVVGFRGSGSNEMLFLHDIFFPDSFLHEKVKFDEDMCVAFISDLHTGSFKHLNKNVEKFLDWLNSDDETVKKIKYIFVTGDNVDGVGIFPGQEYQLTLKSMEEQYELVEHYMKRVPDRITVFMAPGQHDATRVAEPQPLINEKYASGLYAIDNLVLVTNPCMVKLIEGSKEFKVLMYHGASIHAFISEIKELRLMKAHKCPAKAVTHMLKRRHLSPTHGAISGVYIPYVDNDPLVINEVPDVMCTGEVHRLDIENYHGTLIVANSCWQEQTPFEEKVGNEPDYCKVPVLNLKTRELKVFDFWDGEEKKEENADGMDDDMAKAGEGGKDKEEVDREEQSSSVLSADDTTEGNVKTEGLSSGVDGVEGQDKNEGGEKKEGDGEEKKEEVENG